MSTDQNKTGTATPEEWSAFIKMDQIKQILSPQFAELLNLARAEGLLDAILGGDLATVEKHGSELLAALAAQIHSRYRQR